MKYIFLTTGLIYVWHYWVAGNNLSMIAANIFLIAAIMTHKMDKIEKLLEDRK